MKEIIKDILNYLTPYKKRILFTVICLLVFGIVSLLPPSSMKSLMSLLIVFIFVVEGYKWIGQPELWGSKIGKTMLGKITNNESKGLEGNIEEVTIIKLFTDKEESEVLNEIEQNPELIDDLDTIQYKATINLNEDVENQIIPEGTIDYKYEYHIIYDGSEFYHVASYEMSDGYEED
ncbi:hypothetical protein [Staphylococcus aureus]|uniref:hypothetical protein n=1 Tax=Staphylococcus aureus TaxID=1280 RepID=UPI001CF225AA|nr:hypothetical protein [Staphylococcus aureus]MBZ8166083.1 hypothetical protein [Staphylococcus aureus]MBZ8170156.1 hypothetical protein [Staphylococcus aureus]